jgi:hypothetical protein
MSGSPSIDDISVTSTREAMFSKIRELWDALTTQQDERLAVFAKKEQEIRAKYAGRQQNLVAITATATEDEWKEAVDFLANWEEEMTGVLALWRIYDGARIALGLVPTADSPTAPAEATVVEAATGGSPKKGGSRGKS